MSDPLVIKDITGVDNKTILECYKKEFTEESIEKILDALRPHGKWKLIKDKNKNINAECPFCKFAIEGIAYNYEIWEIQQFIKNGDFEFEFPNFCEHCGADMRGEEE